MRFVNILVVAASMIGLAQAQRIEEGRYPGYCRKTPCFRELEKHEYVAKKYCEKLLGLPVKKYTTKTEYQKVGTLTRWLIRRLKSADHKGVHNRED